MPPGAQREALMLLRAPALAPHPDSCSGCHCDALSPVQRTLTWTAPPPPLPLHLGSAPAWLCRGGVLAVGSQPFTLAQQPPEDSGTAPLFFVPHPWTGSLLLLLH